MKVSCVPDGGQVCFYTLSGETVRKVAPIGQLAHWDGRNLRNVPCSSGIYYYLVLDPGGKAVHAGKLLLLNGQ